MSFRPSGAQNLAVGWAIVDSEEKPKKEPETAASTTTDDADASAAAPSAATAEASSAPAAEATATAGASSAPASPTVTSPPMSPQRQLEARPPDDMTTSVVRALTFADTFLMSGEFYRLEPGSSRHVSTRHAT